MAQSLAPLKRKNNFHSLLFYNILNANKFFKLSNNATRFFSNIEKNNSTKNFKNEYNNLKGDLINPLIKNSNSNLINNANTNLSLKTKNIFNTLENNKLNNTELFNEFSSKFNDINIVSESNIIDKNISYTTLYKQENINSNLSINLNDSAASINNFSSTITMEKVPTSSDLQALKGANNKLTNTEVKNSLRTKINYDYIYNQVNEIMEKKEKQNRLISYFPSGRKISD